MPLKLVMQMSGMCQRFVYLLLARNHSHMESKNVISLQDGTVLEPTKEELSQAGLFAGREDIIGYELKGA